MRRGIFEIPVVVCKKSPETAMAIHGQLSLIYKVERVNFGRDVRYHAVSPLFDDLPDSMRQTPVYKLSVFQGSARAIRTGENC